eukprot:g1422.t1
MSKQSLFSPLPPLVFDLDLSHFTNNRSFGKEIGELEQSTIGLFRRGDELSTTAMSPPIFLASSASFKTSTLSPKPPLDWSGRTITNKLSSKIHEVDQKDFFSHFYLRSLRSTLIMKTLLTWVNMSKTLAERTVKAWKHPTIGPKFAFKSKQFANKPVIILEAGPEGVEAEDPAILHASSHFSDIIVTTTTDKSSKSTKSSKKKESKDNAGSSGRSIYSFLDEDSKEKLRSHFTNENFLKGKFAASKKVSLRFVSQDKKKSMNKLLAVTCYTHEHFSEGGHASADLVLHFPKLFILQEDSGDGLDIAHELEDIEISANENLQSRSLLLLSIFPFGAGFNEMFYEVVLPSTISSTYYSLCHVTIVKSLERIGQTLAPSAIMSPDLALRLNANATKSAKRIYAYYGGSTSASSGRAIRQPLECFGDALRMGFEVQINAIIARLINHMVVNPTLTVLDEYMGALLLGKDSKNVEPLSMFLKVKCGLARPLDKEWTQDSSSAPESVKEYIVSYKKRQGRKQTSERISKGERKKFAHRPYSRYAKEIGIKLVKDALLIAIGTTIAGSSGVTVLLALAGGY